MNQIELTEDEKLIRQMEEDPVFFIEVFLGKELAPKQRDFVEAIQHNKHVVAIWSRQTGKSTTLSCYIVWRLLYGKGAVVNGVRMEEKIIVLAPIKEQLKNLHEKIRNIIDKNDFVHAFIDKMNTERIIAKNNNSIIFLSASPGTHIRGFTSTCTVIDETQDITDDKYSADILPFGSTTNANIIECGTPKTKNHFWQTMHSKSVKVVKQLWFECPFLSEEYVLSKKAISPEALWRQEYLCEFIEEGVMAFPSTLFDDKTLQDYTYYDDLSQLNKEAVGRINDLQNDGATYTMGLDLGKKEDSTVLTIYRTDKRPISLMLKLVFPLNMSYVELASQIAFVYRIFQPVEFNIDYTNEKSFVDILREKDVPVILDQKSGRGALAFTQINKREMISNTRVLLENKQLVLPIRAELLMSQFRNQMFEITEQQKFVYYHPTNENDDELWSTLLALKNVNLQTAVDIINFINPWEKRFDNVVHPTQDSIKEVLLVNKDRKNYDFSQMTKRFSERNHSFSSRSHDKYVHY